MLSLSTNAVLIATSGCSGVASAAAPSAASAAPIFSGSADSAYIVKSSTLYQHFCCLSFFKYTSDASNPFLHLTSSTSYFFPTVRLSSDLPALYFAFIVLFHLPSMVFCILSILPESDHAVICPGRSTPLQSCCLSCILPCSLHCGSRSACRMSESGFRF